MTHRKRNAFRITIRARDFMFAFHGLKYVFRTQRNARFHLTAAAVVIFLGFLLDVSRIEWCLLLFSIGFVLAAEAFNTAIESLTDLASPDIHKLAEITKDVSAGAVLLAAITAAIIGAAIFLPKIFPT